MSLPVIERSLIDYEIKNLESKIFTFRTTGSCQPGNLVDSNYKVSLGRNELMGGRTFEFV